MKHFRQSIIKAIKPLLIIVLGLIVAALLFILVSRIALDITMNAKIKLFSEKRNEFEQLLDGVQTSIASNTDTYTNQYIEHPIPQALADLDITAVWSYGDNIFLDFKSCVMGLIPYGIVYAENVSTVEDWYRLVHIDDNWYYFRNAP